MCMFEKYFLLLMLAVKHVEFTNCDTGYFKLTEKSEIQGTILPQSKTAVNEIHCAKICTGQANCYKAWYFGHNRTCFIVEKSNQTLFMPPNQAVLEKYKYVCDSGWTLYKESCYLGVETHKKWGKSRDFCREQGGYLVTITSSEEQNFVVQLRDDAIGNEFHIWAGARNIFTGGSWEWRWSSKEAWDYTHWEVNETSGYNAVYEQKCLQLYSETKSPDSSWKDAFCGESYPSICEKRPVLKADDES